MKKIFLILCCFSAISLWAGQPLKVLRPLNKALFSTPLDKAITRQTFAQLGRSVQVAQLPKPERALLLTHKFISEQNRWPRTVITRDGHVIPPEQYTPMDKQEANLGFLLRHILEGNYELPEPIREELETLKFNYSRKYTYMNTLDQLNHWLTVHHTWPRSEISPSDKPLTPQQQEKVDFEMELARRADRICQGRVVNLPWDLVKQIRQIRSFYEPSYVPPVLPGPQTPNAQPRYIEDFDIPFSAYPHEVPGRAEGIYVNLETDAHQILQRLAADKPEKSHISKAYAKQIRHELINWLQTYHYWPYVVPNKPLSKYSLLEMKGELLAKAVLRVRASHFEMDDIRQNWVNGFLETNEDDFPQQLGDTLKLTPYTTPLLVNMSPELNPSPRPDLENIALHHSPIKMLKDLQDWLIEYNMWPLENGAPKKLTEKELARRDDLARRIEAFAVLAHPDKQFAWRTHTPQTWKEVLSANAPYQNRELETLRQLYRQFFRTYTQNQ